jgi:hypothetical protein
VGLITGLLTLPLAPVRGTVWLAQIIQAEAESRELDEPSILAALQELELAREAGEFSEEEIEEAEDQLVERLMALRGVGGQESHGEFG